MELQHSNGAKLNTLSDIVPLRMPLSLSIGLTNTCNLKCNYCYHGSEKKREDIKQGIYKPHTLTEEEIDLIVDQTKKFGGKYKQVTLVGNGEPLLAKTLLYAIRRLKEVSEKIKITTNATLLTDELSLNMIEAGVDLIKISFQGMKDEKYKKICGADVSVEQLIERIRFLYDHRKQASIHLKVADMALDEGEEIEFKKAFKDITDAAWIERISPVDNAGKWVGDVNRWGNDERIKVCFFPFYYIYINERLDVIPCCGGEFVIGNLRNKDIKSLWDDEIRLLCIRQLEEKAYLYPKCLNCHVMQAMYRPENNLDSKKEEILNRYNKEIL